MAGEEEADGVVFALQPLGRRPGLVRRDAQLHIRRGHAAEHVDHAAVGAPRAPAGPGHHGVERGAGARAVRLDLVEAPAAIRFSSVRLLTSARVDAPREIREIRERPVAACLDDRLDGLAPHALHGGERIADRAALAS